MKLDVYIDGGIRRGTDVIKALALGAKAVGLGRPFLYGNGTYGEEGVLKVSRFSSSKLKDSSFFKELTRLFSLSLRPFFLR